jgi:hypothetical protein
MPDEILPGPTAPATTPHDRPFLPLGLAALVIGPIVIGLLILSVVVAILWYGKKSVEEAHARSMTQTSLQDLCVAIKAYETDFGVYPPGPNAAFVRALQSSDRQGTLHSELANLSLSPAGKLLDRWQQPFVYKIVKATDRSGIAYRLYSIGPNGVDEEGKGDDIAVRN